MNSSTLRTSERYTSQQNTAQPSARGINWRLWALLLGAAIVGAAAVLPYSFQIVANLPLPADERPPLPLPLIVALSLVQSTVLFGLVTLGGLCFAPRARLKGAPLLEDWLGGRRPDSRVPLLAGLAGGVLAGGLLTAVDLLMFAKDLPPAVLRLLDAPLWQRLLAGVFYGGVNEELLMRLFMVSLLVWLFGKLFRRPAGQPAAAAVILAVAVSSLLFGLGHLPALAALTTPTPDLIVRTLLLNGIAGLAFGLLYVRYGLESAICAHAAAHLVMQIPGAWLVLAASQHLSA